MDELFSAEPEQVLVARVLSLAVEDKSVLDEVSPDDFYNGILGEVWSVARRLHGAGRTVSARSVLAEAGKSDPGHPMAQVVAGVTRRRVSAQAAREARREVQDLARRRRLVLSLQSALEHVSQAPDYQTAHSFASEALQGVDGADMPDTVVSFATAVDRWQERMDRPRESARVFPTPWPALNDRLSGGLHAGRSYVVGGRPGEGKSIGGANLVQHAAEHGHVGLIFSLEMGETEVVSRAIASGADAEYAQITSRTIDDFNYGRIRSYIAEHRNIPLFIADRANVSMDYVTSTCRAVKRKHGLDVVFVDYLQLLEPTDSRVSRERQVAMASRSLKLLAREMDCAVVTACQLNRSSAEQGRQPRLSDLRESGAIEQDADVVILLHHPAEGDVDLVVAKNRTGPQAVVSQRWAGYKASIK